MFIYIIAKAVTDPNFQKMLGNTGNNNTFAGLFTGGGMVIVLFNFILIIALLLGALIAAKGMGAKR